MGWVCVLAAWLGLAGANARAGAAPAALQSAPAAPAFLATPLAALLRAVDAHYNALHTLKADFTEIYSTGLTGQSESGTLYLGKPGRMRWDYRDPDKLFLVDGHSVWLYVPGDGEVQRTALKRSDDLRTPLRFLLGHTDLPRELGDAGYGELDPLDPGDLVVHGVPLQLESLYREVWIEVTPGFGIRRMMMAAVDGTTTDIQLSRCQENVALPDSLFQFQPPPGVPIVEAGGGASVGH